MSKKILLVNPWIYDFTAFDLWLKPLGLLYLASHLLKRGYEVELLDCLNRLDPDCPPVSRGPRYLREAGCGSYYKEILPRPSFFRHIPRYWGRFGLPLDKVKSRMEMLPSPDWVFITTGMTYWYPGAVIIKELAQKIWPEAQTVWGGIYPILCPEHADNWGFDYVVKVADPVLVMKELGGILGTDFKVESYEDFFSLKPAFFLYPRLSYTVLLTSLGCPFRCSYCASGKLYSSFWHRPTEEIIEEILFSKEQYGIKDIAFYDDALLFQAEKHFLPLLKKLAELSLDLHFHLPNSIHPAYVTPQIAQLMKKVGFKTLRMSLETASPWWQEKTGGKVNNYALERATRYFLEAGFAPQDIEVYLLFGLPGISEEEMISSIKYVKSWGLKPRLSLYSPIPSTPDYYKIDNLPPDEPLFHNKIAFLYQSGSSSLYQKLQKELRSS